MSDLDPQKLDFLRSRLWELVDPARETRPTVAEKFRKDLAALGLDLNDDATYQLLRDDLTKQKFDDLETLHITYEITKKFHASQNLSWQQYSGITAASKHGAVVDLVRYLDHYQAELQNRPLPADADPYHRQILQMLRDDHAYGRLQEYLKDLAVDAAVESFTNLQTSWDRTKDSLKKPHGAAQTNYYNAFYPIKTVKAHVAEMNSVRQNAFFTRTGASPAVLDKWHREMALTLMAALIEARPEPRPIHVSGHSQDAVYHYALTQFEDAGIDMNDNATYTAIGMDRETFWENYRQQVAWLNTTSNKPRKVFSPPQP